MKKILLFLTFTSLILSSCRKDDDNTTTTPEVSLETQNSYDDEAIQKFLKDNYFDSRGNIVAFSSTSTADDNEKPLFNYNVIKLNSGVVYISRYTPTNGKTIGATDKISILQKTTTYVATKDSKGTLSFSTPIAFRNTVTSGTGNPEYDPSYYYVKDDVLSAYNTAYNKTYTRTFYEIEGLQEGLKYFQSCEIPNSENYNLQGVIIIPSRAAFARDDAFPYLGSMKDKSFVFNFQIYKTETR